MSIGLIAAQFAEEQRLADMRIDLFDFMELLRAMDGTNRFSIEGLPEDAQIVAGTFDWQRNAFMIRFRSKDFAFVRPGEQVPRLGAKIVATQLDDSPFYYKEFGGEEKETHAPTSDE